MSHDSPTDAPAIPYDAATELAAWRRRTLALALKLVWNRDDAEDLTQEAFVRATLKRISPADACFGPWLMRTVANLCVNHRRRRRAEPLTEMMLERAGARVGQARDDLDRMNGLRIAMEQLPDQQRLALVLRGMEGLDYDAIAGIMELSTAAVRTHVHLARKRLIRTSGPQGEPECPRSLREDRP